ncbi:hypothetical protein Rhal01_03062 [Rubritalea halochordaticola]|uniref:MADS-box domain-containing protein n=2 Tax=Rubritalea halochordaticola TaxID=714537 RepID=A0ABP9V2H1_9BACT
MRKIFNLIMISAFCGYQAKADLPPKPSYKDFAKLTQNSPFGVKKPAPVQAPVVAPPANTTLMLTGVTKLADGWSVGVSDKKNPTRGVISLSSNQSVDGISIVKVEQDPDNYRNTKVTVKQGGATYTLKFDSAEVEKGIQESAKQSQQAVQKLEQQAAAPQAQPQPVQGDQGSEEYKRAREEMMREAAELRKMRESGNTGDDYQKRRQALMEKANELRRDWRSRRRGGDEASPGGNDGGDRRRR